jgi:hypothetical protein
MEMLWALAEAGPGWDGPPSRPLGLGFECPHALSSFNSPEKKGAWSHGHEFFFVDIV